MRGNYFFMDPETKRVAHVIATVGPSGKHAIVNQMFSPEALRGKGVQRELMDQVCWDADAEGITLHVQPVPDGEVVTLQDHDKTNLDRLIAFFGSLGFAFEDGNVAGMMIRPPKT